MQLLFKTLPIFLFFSACATAPPLRKDFPPLQDLLEIACKPGKDIQSAQGTVWMKASSSEVSGQFLANVKVSAPDQLKLEVTNPLGGTEAMITVDNQHYEITNMRRKGKSKNEGDGSWGGIPLLWATHLFLGKIPCPTLSDDMNLSLDGQNNLIVQVPKALGVDPQKFIFSFAEKSGKLWPDSLRWELQRVPLISVDFNFDAPEDETGSPKKWEARSSHGTVKVRWRDRNFSAQRVH